MDVTVVIPCRAGSTRVKNKNFRPFGGSNLLEIKVNQAKSLGLPTVVNSDSEIAKEIAPELWAEHQKYVDNSLLELFERGLISVEYNENLEPSFRISPEGIKMMEDLGFNPK